MSRRQCQRSMCAAPRLALLLADIPGSERSVTLSRLCASGLNAIGAAARAIKSGEVEFALADGVDSPCRRSGGPAEPSTLRSVSASAVGVPVPSSSNQRK